MTYNGAKPEKSHFDCKVNKVSPIKTAKVISSASSTSC